MAKFSALLFFIFLSFSALYPQEVLSPVRINHSDFTFREDLETTIKKEGIFSWNSVAETISNTVGISLQQQGGVGQYEAVRSRGTTSNQSSLYMNGVSQPSRFAGIQHLERIPSGSIVDIKIFKSYKPIYYSENSIGSITDINTYSIITKEQIFEQTTTLASFDTFMLNLNVGQSDENNSLFINLNWIDADNSYSFPNDNGTPFNTTDDKISRKSNNGYENKSIQIQVQNKTRWGLFKNQLSLSIGEQEIGGPQNVTILNAENHFQTFSHELTYISKPLFWDLKWHAAFQTILEKEQHLDLLGEGGFSANHLSFSGVHHQFKNYFELPLGDGFYLNYLVLFKQEVFKKNDRIHHQFNRWQTQEVTKALELIRQFWQDQLEFKANIRGKWLLDKSEETDGIEYHQFDSSLQGMLLFKPFEDFIFNIAVGQSSRTPSLFEKFGDSGLVIGNGKLRSERAIEYNFGSEISYPLWGEQRIRFQAYQRHVKDQIAYDLVNAGIARPENIEKTKTTGFEWEHDFKLKQWFSLSYHYSFIHSKVDSNDIYHDKFIPNQPKHAIHLQSHFKIKKLSFFYQLNINSEIYSDKLNQIKKPTEVLHHIFINYCWRSLDVTLGVKNLGDRYYEDYLNYPLPGRSFWFLLNTSF